MERREERERAALPKAAVATSGEEGRLKVWAAMPAWLPQVGRPVVPLSSREREMGREEASGRTKGERERERENHGAREEIDRRKWAPRFSQI
jgi:hypothetical protein